MRTSTLRGPFPRGALIALVLVTAGPAPAAPSGADVEAITKLVQAQADGFGAEPDGAPVVPDGPLLWVSGADRLDQLWAAQLGFIQQSAPKLGGDDVEGVPSAAVKGLQIGVADDRQSAWVGFTLDVTLTGPGKKPRTVKQRYRVTEVLIRKGERWTIAAAHWSLGMKNAAAVKAAKQHGLEAAPLAPGDASVGPAELVQAVQIAVAPGIGLTLGDTVSDRADVFAFGSDPGESYPGAKFKKAAAKWKFQMQVRGPVLAGLAPGGKVGWALANVDATFGTGAKAYTIPYRVMFVFVHNGGIAGREMEWDVVQAHFSIEE